MNTLAATIPDEDIPRARVALLLKHFSAIKDDREPWLVVYPLKEVLLLVVCRIASCDDFDDIVPWGEHHIDFLRRICEFHHGTPCERWVRTLFNRVDPVLFSRCFNSWVAALWPDRHEFIAIDGKTSRRTHDERKGLKALHTLSAYPICNWRWWGQARPSEDRASDAFPKRPMRLPRFPRFPMN